MRCFFAVNLPDKVKKEVFNLLEKHPDKRFVKPEDFHLTLKFIGDVESVDELIRAGNNVRFKRFTAGLKSIGCFPDKNFIKVLWIGVEHGSKEMVNLAKLIESEIKLSKNKDYDLIPHLTILRCNNDCDKKILDEEFSSSIFEVNSFFLIQSTLTREGPVYNIVKEFNLL